MTGWTCPHQNREKCMLLKKDCLPAQKGCVLKGKLVMSSPEGIPQKKEPSKTPKKKRL